MLKSLCVYVVFQSALKSHFLIVTLRLLFFFPIPHFHLLFNFSPQGADRVVPVPAVLAGLPALHRNAAREASVSDGAALPCRRRSAASPGH